MARLPMGTAVQAATKEVAIATVVSAVLMEVVVTAAITELVMALKEVATEQALPSTRFVWVEAFAAAVGVGEA